MPAIFFALISLFGWSIGDIFATITSRKMGSFSAGLWLLILRLIFFSLYIPYALDSLKNITFGMFGLNIILGAVWVVGIVGLYEGLRVANAALVGAFANSFGAITVIISMIFLRESISLNQAIAIVIIFLGLILSSLNFREFKKGKSIMSEGAVFGLTAMFCWGIYFAFIKIPVQSLGWFWPNYISLLLFPLIFLFTKFRKLELHKPTFNNSLFPLLLLVFLSGIADFSYNFAIGKGLVSIVAPIAGSAPALFVILAFIFFKDKITKQQILGIITTLVGIVLLSFFSV